MKNNTQKDGERYALRKGYPMSDKEQFTTTYWTQHNIAKNGFIAGRLSYAEEELKRLYEWVTDENRKPAQTFFTAGWLRNVAREIEIRLRLNQGTEDGNEKQ